MAHCRFNCGVRNRATTDMANNGGPKYPNWACRPCGASYQAMNRRRNADKAYRAWADNLEAKEYTCEIVRLRIREDPGNMMEPGIDGREERKKEAAKYVFEQKQSVEIEDKAWAMELDRLAFGANMKYIFGINDTTEHSRLWAIALRDESVDKQGTKDNPIIRVVQPKQIAMSKIRGLSAKVAASSAIQNRADEVGAFRQLQHLANRAIADPAFAGHGQELLAEGMVFNP
jgi:hypothetical protein